MQVESIQGLREYMEDTSAFLQKHDMTIAMVCDGHGGGEMSKMTSNELPEILLNTLHGKRLSNIKTAEIIRNTIVDWGDDHNKVHSGTTLTGVLIRNGVVYCFNVGDSRTCFKLTPGSFIYMLKPVFASNGDFKNDLVVECYRPRFFVTRDHSPDDPDEQTRIYSSGGMIQDKRLNGILSLTRAIGDSGIGAGLSWVPDIYWTKVENVDKGDVVMFSDGAYEQERYSKTVDVSSDTLYDMVVSQGVKKTVDYAYKNGSTDNITVATLKI